MKPYAVQVLLGCIFHIIIKLDIPIIPVEECLSYLFVRRWDSKSLLEFSEDFIPRSPILEADTIIPQSIAGFFKFNRSIHKEVFQIKQILKETNGCLYNFTSFISSKYIK